MVRRGMARIDGGRGGMVGRVMVRRVTSRKGGGWR